MLYHNAGDKCRNKEVDTYPFGPAVVCLDCGNAFQELPAVFVGGIKEGTPTWAAWKAAALAKDRAKMAQLEAAIPVADRVTAADLAAYLKPAVVP